MGRSSLGGGGLISQGGVGEGVGLGGGKWDVCLWKYWDVFGFWRVWRVWRVWGFGADHNCWVMTEVDGSFGILMLKFRKFLVVLVNWFRFFGFRLVLVFVFAPIVQFSFDWVRFNLSLAFALCCIYLCIYTLCISYSRDRWGRVGCVGYLMSSR